tara:strand:+ start:871 stop:2520 length:1650 start_codon:yes stop_codon:yes gene_type:complete
MTNRVLVDANNFKVSRPGIDALTAVYPKDFLIWNNYSSVGAFQTGTVNVSSGIYPFIKQTFPLNNPTGYVPLVLVQQNNGSYAVGGGYYEDIIGFALENDPEANPPTYSEFYTTSGDSVGFRLFVSENYFEIEHTSISPLTYRFVAFYPQTALANYSALPRDITPNSINFSNSPSSTNISYTEEVTVSGISEPIYLTVDSSNTIPSNNRVELLVTGSGSATIIEEGNNSSEAYAVVHSGDKIRFKYTGDGSTPRSTTLTLRNASAGGTILDTVYMAVHVTTNTVNNMNWPDASASGWVRTVPQTVQGPNVPVTLRMTPSNTANANDKAFQAFVNREGTTLPTAWTMPNSASFVQVGGVNAGDEVSWGISSRGTMNNSVTITNITPNPDQTVDTLNINVSVDGKICNHVDFGSMIINNSGNSTATQSSSTDTIIGLTGSLGIAVTIPAFSTPSSPLYNDTADFRIYKNGSLIQTIDCSETAQAAAFTVNNNDQIRFEGYLSLEAGFQESNEDQTWTGTVGIYNQHFGNMFMGLFTLSITATRFTGGGGGF